MPYYEEKKGGELVPAKVTEIPEEAIFAIERADEQSIVEHLTSDFASENFIYSYPIKGGLVVGIGVDGAKEIARLLGNIEVLPDIRVDKDSDPDYIYAMVRARDWRTNVTLVGVGRQCKYIVGDNWQPTDRIDETAFVKAVNKGQRNAILAVAPQEAIAKIVQTFIEAKKLKRLPPTYGKPATPSATAKAGTEEDVLKRLRQQAGIEAGKVFTSDDERKAWQKKEYGVDSMTELTEEQLKDMLAKLKAMKPAGGTPEELGFSSKAEQDQLRKELFNKLLPALGYKSDDEKRQYLKDKGAKATTKMTKEELQNFIEEVKGEIKLAEEAEDILREV
jgi:hypothetical protein